MRRKARTRRLFVLVMKLWPPLAKFKIQALVAVFSVDDQWVAPINASALVSWNAVILVRGGTSVVYLLSRLGTEYGLSPQAVTLPTVVGFK